MFWSYQRIFIDCRTVRSRSKTRLNPEYWQTASELYIWKDKVVANQNLLSFYKVCCVAVIVNSSTGKSCSRHFPRPSWYHYIVVFDIVCFWNESGNIALTNRSMPIWFKTEAEELFEKILIPKVMNLHRSVALLLLLLSKSDVVSVAIIKVIVKHQITNWIQRF